MKSIDIYISKLQHFVNAISLLRKRKLYEAEITKLHHIQWTLETQCFQLESAVSTADAFQAMSAGTQTLQQLQTTTPNVEQVDDIMMDIQEDIQIAQQVNTAIGQGIDFTTITTTTGQPIIITDDDLLRELEELQQQPQKQSVMDLKTQLDMAENGRKFNTTARPEAAAVCGSGLTNREAKDFRRLQAELAM